MRYDVRRDPINSLRSSSCSAIVREFIKSDDNLEHHQQKVNTVFCGNIVESVLLSRILALAAFRRIKQNLAIMTTLTLLVFIAALQFSTGRAFVSPQPQISTRLSGGAQQGGSSLAVTKDELLEAQSKIDEIILEKVRQHVFNINTTLGFSIAIHNLLELRSNFGQVRRPT